MINVTQIRDALRKGSSDKVDEDLIESMVDQIVDLLMPEDILYINI